MKKIIMGAVLFLSLAFATTSTEAQGRYTKQNQKQRIHEGVRHGKLTRSEARNLRMEQARITKMKRMAWADGRLSPKERIMIANAERRANRNIYLQKHDRQTRF